MAALIFLHKVMKCSLSEDTFNGVLSTRTKSSAAYDCL